MKKIHFDAFIIYCEDMIHEIRRHGVSKEMEIERWNFIIGQLKVYKEEYGQ